MKISCPACSAKYSIADEKVSDRLAKIRCRKCGTTIVIDGKVSPPNVYASDGASMPSHDAMHDPSAGASGAAHEYSVDFGDNDQRTMPLADLIAAYNAGTVTSETFVWAEGMADWKPLGEVPEVVDALHSAAGSAPPPAAPQPAAMPFAAPAQPAYAAPAQPAYAPPAPAPEPAAFGSGPAAFGSAPGGYGAAAEAPRAAARAGGGRGATADLFGSFEAAGSEEDVATSAPAPVAAPATGARNESSVLFSLSALTASAPAQTAPSASSAMSFTAASKPAAGSATREDSGLIDLKALTASAEPAGAPGLGVGPAPLGIAPLGMAAPLGTPLGSGLGGVEAQIAPPAKSKTGLFIGGGIAVAAIAIAIAIVAVSGKEPAPVAQPTTVAAPAPAPAPTPTPTQETTTAKAPATGTASEDEKPPDDKTKTAATQRPTGGYKRPPSKAGPAPAPAAAPEKKPPPKKSGGCGCAPGDLQCAMACAAKGG